MSILYALDLAGTLVFAISGILTAIDKKFDLVGAAVIGFVTAVGGGTLRDLLLGQTPVGWMNDLTYLGLVGIALPLSYLGRGYISKLRRSMFIFDTVGIAIFTIIGLEKTLTLGLSPVIAVMMGIVSAVFGGVTRDVLCAEVPLIFRREIYATACLIGGVIFLIAEQVSSYRDVNIGIAIAVVFLIRYLAVKNSWHIGVKPLT
ncbi:MAG: trimeric intracellular cation channel family protein [Saprospiraceae bacterium]